MLRIRKTTLISCVSTIYYLCIQGNIIRPYEVKSIHLEGIASIPEFYKLFDVFILRLGV